MISFEMHHKVFRACLAAFVILACQGPGQTPAALRNNGSAVPDPDRSTTVQVETGGGVCSGIIISPHPHVLTSAHCIHDRHRVRVLGQWTEPTAIDVPEKFAARRLSEAGDVLYDLAVITLPQGTATPGYVRIAERVPQTGESITMRGYGVTHYGGGGAGVLREGHNALRPCMSALAGCPGCRRDWIPKEFRVPGAGKHRGMICLSGPVVEVAPEGEVSTAFGDSGSGVLNSNGELIAVAGGGTWDPNLRDVKVSIFGVALWKGHLDFIQNVLARTGNTLATASGHPPAAVGRADGSDGPPGVQLPSQCRCEASGPEQCRLTMGERIIAVMAANGAGCESSCMDKLREDRAVRLLCY